MPATKPIYKTIVESYVPPVTLSLPAWRRYVANGYNTLYGDAIIPGGSEDNAAGCCRCAPPDSTDVLTT
jgi:hypothetical protein